jgi:hypothetical protein
MSLHAIAGIGTMNISRLDSIHVGDGPSEHSLYASRF